jgi:hypothetical protein
MIDCGQRPRRSYTKGAEPRGKRIKTFTKIWHKDKFTKFKKEMALIFWEGGRRPLVFLTPDQRSGANRSEKC